MATTVPMTILLQTAGGSTVVTVGQGPVAAGGSGYEIVAAGETGLARRRTVETSPYLNYEYEVDSVIGAMTYGLTVRCVGTSWSSVRSLQNDLTDAVEQQPTWKLIETIGGVSHNYSCWAADWQAPLTTDLMVSYRTEVAITIPCRRFF